MNVHLVAICGTGMGSLAGLLKEAGHEVRGSDQAFYPPMSERLQAWRIPTMQGYDPAHLVPEPQLVVVGNACRKDNPEVLAAHARGIRTVSFPQALSELFLVERKPIVVAGTHGKTTTASLLSYLLVEAGLDPWFLLGGIPLNYGKSFRIGAGEHFVVEGDEYDSAFFDKRPKFLHYRPKLTVLTSLELDHVDIYPDMQAYRDAFVGLVDLLDQQGLLVACHDHQEVRNLADRARCRVISYGLSQGADWRATDILEGPQGVSFRLEVNRQSRGTLTVPLWGEHNLANTLSVLAVVDALGIDPNRASGLLTGFRGVARRMQVRGEASGVTVLDDFAHHPTEVAATVRAARRRYPQAWLTAVFEPRTNSSRRRVFQRRYEEVFDPADRVVLVPPYNPEQIPAGERFDSGELVRALGERGKSAVLCRDADQVVAKLVAELPRRAVVLVMSNGAFDHIHDKLLGALKQRENLGP